MLKRYSIITFILFSLVLLITSVSLICACSTSKGYNSIKYECTPTDTNVGGNIDVKVTVWLMEETDIAKLQHATWVSWSPNGDGGVLFLNEEPVNWSESEKVLKEGLTRFRLVASISATATNEGTVIIEIDQNLPAGVSPILFVDSEGSDPCEITIDPGENGHKGNGEGNGDGDDGEGNGHDGEVDTEGTTTCFTQVWQIGDYNEKHLSPYDELQPDEIVSSIDFTVGEDPLSHFPGLTKFDDDIAIRINIHFDADMPQGGKLLMSWSPGAVGNEFMSITLDGQEIGALERTGAVNEEWWNSYERFIDSFDIGPLEDDSHTLTIECTSGDGAIWDWLRLEKKVLCHGEPEDEGVIGIQVGSRNYYMALAPPDKSILYVGDYGPVLNGEEGKVWLINTTNNEVIDVIEGLGDGFPYQMVFAPDGNNAYLAITKAAGSTVTEGNNRIVVIDASDNEVTGSIDIKGAQNYGSVTVAMHPDGGYVYTTHHGLNRIDAISTESGMVAYSIDDVGSVPMGIAITSDRSRLWVVNSVDNTLAVIDIQSDPMELSKKSIPLGLESSGSHAFITITPDDTHAYVTKGEPRIAIVNIDPDSASYLQVEYVETSAIRLSQVAISPDGKRALVANNTHSVLVINIDPASESYRQIDSIPIGYPTTGVVYANLPQALAYVSTNEGVWVIRELPGS